MKSNYVESYHGLRGLAALLVFFAHSIGGYIKHNPQYEFIGLDSVVNVGVFGVEIFFILSGYVIYESIIRNTAFEFFKKRFFRIYPLFLFFTLLFFFSNLLFSFSIEKNNYLYLFLNLLFLNLFFNTPAITPNAWSLTYEVLFYFTSFLFFSRDVKFLFRFFSVFFVFYTVYFFPLSVYFLSGVFLSFNKIKLKRIIKSIDVVYSNVISFFVFFVLLFFLTMDREYSSWSVVFKEWNVFLVVLLSFFLVLFLQDERIFLAKILRKKIFLFLGTISYSFYLSHPYSYKLVRLFFESQIFLSDWLSGWLFITVFVLVNSVFSIYFSWFFYFLIEKRFSNGVFHVFWKFTK